MNYLLRSTKYSFSRVIVPVVEQIKIKKKKYPDLNQLKRQLNIYKQKKKTDPNVLYQQIPHRDVYKQMDTSFQSFFRKRQYSIENFNFYLNVLGQQQKLLQIQKALQKMQALDIQLNQTSYNYIIRAASKVANIQMAEKYFKLFQQKFQVNKFIYTSLMLAYVKTKNQIMADSILFQMMQNKLVPDIVTFTTLINAHLKSRNLSKCWQLHKLVQKQKILFDQPYVSVMLQVYAASHDTQKAIKLYKQNIEDSKNIPYLQTVNSYLKALSARRQYSKEALSLFFSRVEIGQHINVTTCLYALKACAMSLNIKEAIQIIKIMKIKNIQPNKYIYNGLFRCYAAVCSIPGISLQLTQVYINDAWKLLQQVTKKNMIDTAILNNFLFIHVQAFRIQQIEGLVLPLYDKYGVQKDAYTYEYLYRVFQKKQDLSTFMRIWQIQEKQLVKKKQQFIKLYGIEKLAIEQKRRQTFRPNFNSINSFLQVGIKLMDMNQILKAFQMLKQMNRMPKTKHLQFLGQLKDLPQEIQAQLLDYQLKFGKIRGNTKKQHAVQDPQNK